jgi:DnaA family protein
VKQLLLDIAPAPRPSLDNFVPGRNVELLTALRVLPDGASGKRSLYLWGPSGSGRTHLLHAAIDDFSQRGLNVQGANGRDWDGLNTCDLVVLDDVEKLDEAAQIALFNLFNQLRESGRALIVSGPCAPTQLNLRDDLRTRLGWGLVYQLLALDDAEKTQALQRHAADRGFQLSAEVVDYLLRHVRRDLPTLMGMLDALDEWSLTAKKPVTVPLLRQLLQLPLNLD